MPKKTTKPEPEWKTLRTIGFQCANDLATAIETERAKMKEADPTSRVTLSDCVRRLLADAIKARRAASTGAVSRR